MQIDIKRNVRRDIGDEDTRAYSTTPIKFCFVGPRGVGKTSLLASMYDQIKKNHVTNLLVDPHSKLGAMTGQVLDRAYQNMLEMIEETELGAVVDLSLGIAGTTDPSVFEFIGEHIVEDNAILKRSKYKRFDFVFHLTDMSGKWYDLDSPNKGEAEKSLKESFVSFLAVDAPALMKGSATCNRVNKNNVISQWYEEAAKTLAVNKHTVVVVLSRCEKYWNDKDGMLDKLQETYGSMICSLKLAGVEVYVTWVKTIGGIEFSHFDTERKADGTKDSNARFVRTGEYAPENCATPLQLALGQGLVRAVESIPTDIWDALGWDVNGLAVEAAKSLANTLHQRLNAGSEGTYKKL